MNNWQVLIAQLNDDNFNNETVFERLVQFLEYRLAENIRLDIDDLWRACIDAKADRLRLPAANARRERLQAEFDAKRKAADIEVMGQELPYNAGFLLDLMALGKSAEKRLADAYRIERKRLPPQPWRPWEEWSTEDLLRVQSLDASCGALAEYTRRLPPEPAPAPPKPPKPLPAPPKPRKQPKPKANKEVERMLESLRPVLLSSGERHDDRVWLRERWVPYLTRRQRLLRQVAERIVIDLPDEVYWSFPLACLGGTE